MEREDIVDYVMETPNNSNPAVLRSMLNELPSGRDSSIIVLAEDIPLLPFEPEGEVIEGNYYVEVDNLEIGNYFLSDNNYNLIAVFKDKISGEANDTFLSVGYTANHFCYMINGSEVDGSMQSNRFVAACNDVISLDSTYNPVVIHNTMIAEYDNKTTITYVGLFGGDGLLSGVTSTVSLYLQKIS